MIHSAFASIGFEPGPVEPALSRVVVMDKGHHMAAIDQLIEDATKDNAAIVQIVDKILTHVEAAQLSYKAKLQPRAVGIDVTNRGGYGVNHEDVHALGHDIASVGWSWAEVSKAIAIEEEPGQTTILNLT